MISFTVIAFVSKPKYSKEKRSNKPRNTDMIIPAKPQKTIVNKMNIPSDIFFNIFLSIVVKSIVVVSAIGCRIRLCLIVSEAVGIYI